KCLVMVTDGVCIGHPCCSQHNCKVPLHKSKDRFCPVHANLESVCSIVDCERPVLEGLLTCDNVEHQEIERLHREKGQSRFQLYQPPANAKKVRAKFTCSRTHNEQLAVAPCGMIIGWDMMFGAEGIASIAEFIKRTFRFKALKPDHIFFDNNCSLAQHIKLDPYFSNIGLTVDVFHFKSKHKETHTFCQEHCNPAVYPELIGEDGQGWFFNSSVAEQVNVWIGGYHAICREMLVDKYDFLLDQMILCRNRATRAKLEAQG
ncbi:hypothetical protein OG21DRAFT_1370836, partial [Imleria badia]